VPWSPLGRTDHEKPYPPRQNLLSCTAIVNGKH
jgi:hypothetical protein